MVEGSQWQIGPKWLIDDPHSWPITNVNLNPEERKTVKSFERITKTLKTFSNCQLKIETNHVLDIIISRSRSLNKIVNVTAYVLRLVGRRSFKVSQIFHSMDLQSRCNSNPINAAEHDDARKVLIKHEQDTKLIAKNFNGFDLETKEYTLNSGRKIHLIAVKSRVQNFPFKFGNQDDSIFALPNSNFAKAIGFHYHRKYHKDVDTVVAHIRKEFWIPQIRRIISNIDKDCQFCLILREKVSTQLMGDLPLSRTLPGKPFLSVSTDLFRPLIIN